MKGVLTPEEQLKVLTRIWGADRDGYVFLPHIKGSCRTRAERRSEYKEGRAYEWPKEKAAILEHLRNHTDDDVYFTPALFNAKRRIEQNVDAERTLWADLDPVDPRTLGDLKPTIAWETSPGRYQAVWLLNTPLTGASWPQRENHRLTLHIGADPSGWDSTQLLRVPGRKNHKPDHGDTPVPGELLWDNGPRFVWDDFEDLPEVGLVGFEDEDSLVDGSLIDSIDRHDVWARVRLKVSSRCRELIASRTSEGADRSDVLWEIERELADAGCTAPEIIAIIRPSVWNKYAGRNDELKRLRIEAAKALAAKADAKAAKGDDDVLEEVDDLEPKPDIKWLADLTAHPIPRTPWLVKNVWTQGGCGFISGAPKSYKSWMALDLALSVSMGVPFLNDEDFTVKRPRPVLYLQEEDDVRLVIDRMSSIIDGKDERRSWKGSVGVERRSPASSLANDTNSRLKGLQAPLSVFWDPPSAPIPLAPVIQGGFVASDPAWQAWLDEKVAEGRFALVVIDTLGTTAGDVDTDRSSDLMAKILKPLKTIAKKHDTAICVVHHNKKPSGNGGGSRAGMEMLGSVALHAWVDCAIYVRSKEAGNVLNVEVESKNTSDQAFKVKVPHMFAGEFDRQVWGPERQVHTDVGEGPKQPAHQTPKNSTAGKRIAFILKGCGGGPVTQEQLDEVAGKRTGDQVEQAIANGFIIRDDDGLLRLPRAS